MSEKRHHSQRLQILAMLTSTTFAGNRCSASVPSNLEVQARVLAHFALYPTGAGKDVLASSNDVAECDDCKWLVSTSEAYLSNPANQQLLVCPVPCSAVTHTRLLARPHVFAPQLISNDEP